MGIRPERKIWSVRLVSFFLLVLFSGYWGSISLFPHSHRVSGITVVHSHPYKTHSDGTSNGFTHSGKELALIQLLSEFITYALVISFVTLYLRTLLQEIPVRSTMEGYIEPGGYFNNSLRAPPSRFN